MRLKTKQKNDTNIRRFFSTTGWIRRLFLGESYFYKKIRRHSDGHGTETKIEKYFWGEFLSTWVWKLMFELSDIYLNKYTWLIFPSWEQHKPL